MSDIITSTFNETISHATCCPNPALDDGPNLKTMLTCPPKDRIRSMIIMKDLVSQLILDFNTLYTKECDEYEMELDCKDIFDKEKHAWPIAKNADIISQGVSLRGIFGSEAMDGMFDCIVNCIKKWEHSNLYAQHQKVIAQLTSARTTAANKKWEKEKTDKLKRDSAAAELDGPPPSRPKNAPAPPQNDADDDCEMADGNMSCAPTISPAPPQFESRIDPRLTSGTNC
ncbi:uncharacterized protein MELLADRAFT_63587 [Melampsora larici-populina 98AG31]|uniref:Uncharacterized protein n=1 Tax=Melampsora larici-populina (strain 98AG31 / pathotype 3-4-7) TaxID=747676 RepID=F4RN71_MELLP|nr:uncharacterized protein MELLADRAFT_63587 [Melampsora larici-populina 98AG31]EGG06249.1 hypothetical protein MELLADRAFT_63587 [Melampsora larici-populina 98AG31]